MSSNGTLSPEAQRLFEKMQNGGVLPGTMPTEQTADVSSKSTTKQKKNPLVAGRFAEMNAFVDTTMAQLTRAEIATWMTMFRFVDAKKNTVAVSVRTIAERSGTSFQHIHKAISSLTDKGLLERIKTGGINSGSSVYKLHPTVHP